MGAIVIGAAYGALGVVRSLGRRGLPVWVVPADDHRLATFSRYTNRTAPWGGTDPARLDALLRLAREGAAGWTLFPTGDEDAALIARHHAELAGHFRLTTPPWEVLRWAYDKRLTYRLAGELGVAHPATYGVGRASELPGLPCRFPAVLKPASKPEHNALTVQKAWRVDDAVQLAARFEEARRLLPEALVMIQEHVPGGAEGQLSYCALCRDGEVLASVVARRARQRPMDYGKASTMVETVDDPEPAEPARRFLEAVRFTGLAEVEFKRDERDGACRLLDVNPRTWSWHSLCGRAGVDFPWLAWRLANGQDVAPVTGRPGVRWVRLTTDLPVAAREIAAGRLSPMAWARSVRPPIELATAVRDDPLPGLLDAPLVAYVALRRLLTGRRRERGSRVAVEPSP